MNCRCSKKFEGVYSIKNHQHSLLFGYYKLGFHCLGFNLFLHCFEKGLVVYLTECPKCMLFTLPDQTAVSYETSNLFLGIAQLVENMGNIAIDCSE